MGFEIYHNGLNYRIQENVLKVDIKLMKKLRASVFLDELGGKYG